MTSDKTQIRDMREKKKVFFSHKTTKKLFGSAQQKLAKIEQRADGGSGSEKGC